MKNIKYYFLFILNLALIAINPPLWADEIGAFADVDPGSKLGIVQVEAPGVSQQILEQFKIVLETKPSPIYSVELSNSYKIEEQEFCLMAQSKSTTNLSSRFCGFNVKRGEKTVITLASFVAKAKDTYTIDLGPLMNFDVLAKSSQTGKESQLQNEFLETYDQNKIALIPLGKLSVSYMVQAKILHEMSFDVKPGENHFDITPPDFRQTIKARMKETPANRLQNSNNAPFLNFSTLSYRSTDQICGLSANTDQAHRCISGEYRTDRKLWFGLDLSKSFESTARAYEVAGEPRYTLDINGYSFPVNLNSTVDLEPINVYDFDSRKSGGIFTMERLAIDNKKFIPIFGYTYFNGINNSYTPTQIKPLTNTSIVVPKGFLYQISTFIKDDTGNWTPQSVHQVDLR